MKRICSIFMMLFVAVIFGGCAASANTAEEDVPTVVATNFVGYDMARTIAGDCAEVTMLLSPGEETHSFDPTPADIIAIQNSDVFLYVGGESDDWVRNILSSMEDSNMIALSFMEHTALYEEEHKEGMMEARGHDHDHDASEEEEEHAHDHDASEEEEDHDHESHEEDGDKEHNEYDEHVWTSVHNAIYLAEAIEHALCDADPDHEEVYHKNAENYIRQLEELDAAYRKVVDEADRKWVLFGDRFPFLYMMKEYGLDYYAAFPGCSSETEPNAATIAFLIDKGREEQVSVILKESLSNGNIAAAIAGEVGAEVLTMYACDNIPAAEFEAGESYLSLMEKNLEVLKEALEG